MSLQANAKTLEGSQHPDRDAQFRHIHDTAARFLSAGDPVVSVDAKKKENVGQFKNGGREYQPKGSPVRVNVHDFPGDAEGKAIPYGVYDIGANTGWVTVGTDHETATFAVNTLRSWWSTIGKSAYPGARCLLITADSGGSNGSRRRAWKTELAALATETGLEISVCHLAYSRLGRFAAHVLGLASGLALAVRPAGSLEAPRAKVGPEDPFCAAVRKDLRAPLRAEGAARTMCGVPPPRL